MVLNINGLDNSSTQDAKFLNREIIQFFEGVQYDRNIHNILSLCPDGITFQDHIYRIVDEIHDSVNLSTFFHRFAKLQKQRHLGGDVDTLYKRIFDAILSNKQYILQSKNWGAQGIGNALYGLQNSSNVPTELFSAFAEVIPTVTHWGAQGIGNALYGIGHIESDEVNDVILLLME